MTKRDSRQLHEAAWPDMFENLQTAYAELTQAQFELERRSAEIDAARGLFQRVIQSMSEALFVLDTSGRIVETNRAATLLLTEDEAALSGRTLEEACGTNEIPATPWQVLERAPDGVVRDLDIELRPRRRRRVHVSISCALVRDHRGKITGVLAVARDITDRKRAEDAVRFLAEASRVLAGSLDLDKVLHGLARLMVPALADWCSIDVLGDDRRIEQLGAAHVDPEREPLIEELRRRFPLPPDAPLGYPLALRTAQPVMISNVIDDEHTATIVQNEEHRQLIATLGFVSHLCVPMFSRGRTIGAITLNLAPGDRRYTPADLEVAQDLAGRAAVAVENASLYQAAQEANRMKDEFLATLSHELRTPLNAILGWSKMLRGHVKDQRQIDRAVEVIERNANAQKQLIEDLLDLSAIVAGKVRFEPRPVDVLRVVETAVDGVRLAAEAKGLTVQLDLEQTCDRIPGDPDRLQQVVWNLLSNAIKFTPPGGVVTATLRCVDSQIEIAIADTGRGIRREFLPHVFDRFRQQDSSTTRTYGGLGLGLAIVKNLVEMHGGTVFAESEGEGRGARFVITLPVIRARRDTSGLLRPVASGNDAPEDASDLNGVRVLVVEDEKDMRELLVLLLERWGATVAVTLTAEEGFALIAAAPPPDIVVSDIGLPREDGYSLLRRIRELPPERGGHVPALALTAYARDEDRRRAEEVGFQRYLAKPFDPAELHTAIAELVRKLGK